MDKLTMAHEMALAMQSAEPITDMKLLSSLCFLYADAMQAEAEKREDRSRPPEIIDGPKITYSQDKPYTFDASSCLKPWLKP